MAILDRARKAWDVFRGRDPTFEDSYGITYTRPDRVRLSGRNSKSVMASIYGQIAVDCSMVNIRHVRLNDEGQYKETINDDLNQALTISANRDQTGRELIRDTVISMFDEGVVALVPSETDVDPLKTDSYQILKIRTAKVIAWMPNDVRLRLYDENDGNSKEITLPKRIVAIVENPFFSIMNESNAISQRYIRTLNLLDRTNENNSAGKLDMIIQLPYATKNPVKQREARARRNSLEEQLTGSQYGIGYIDSTEKVIQLNRSVDNNLWNQAKDLQEQLYSQLGFSPSVFDGTADEKTMLNYYNKTVDPVLSAITESMTKTWISKTARTQGQSIQYYRDPFRLVPVSQLADIADTMRRNEIMSSNEFRPIVGLKPSSDPKANELRNSNLNQPQEETSQLIRKEMKKHVT